MSDCPRCAQPLEEPQVDNVAVALCRGCRGVWLAHADLSAILEASWRTVPVAEAEGQSWAAPAEKTADAELWCPRCRHRMEKYGYLGLATIMMDRCDPCAHVWLDAEELPRMVVALAKANHRAEQSRQRSAPALDLGAAGAAANAPWAAAPDAVRASDWGWLFGRRLTPARLLWDLLGPR